MKTIYIKNSNLVIVRIDCLLCDNPYLTGRCSWSSDSFTVDYQGSKVDGYVTGNWVLGCVKEVCREKQYYTDEERRIILTCIKYCHFSTTSLEMEALVYALGDSEVLSLYDRVNNGLSDSILESKFKDFINENKVLTEYTYVEFAVRNTTHTTEYTIVELAEDLVKDHASILIDGELIGRYSKISKGVIDRESSVRVDYERWNKIVSVSRSSERANLSLTYSIPVSIEVPENTFNVPSGRRELTSLRNFCLIRDGKLWSPKIAIKVNSPDLKKKIESSPAVIFTLLDDNEFFLDLTLMPIQQFITGMTLTETHRRLAEVVAKQVSTKIAVSFCQKREYMERKSLKDVPDKIKEEKPDDIKFLESLGIWGNTYIPKATKPINTGKSYAASKLITDNDREPTTRELGRCIRDYVNSGTCSNRLCESVFKSIKFNSTWKDTLKDYNKILSDLKEQKKRLVFDIVSNKVYESLSRITVDVVSQEGNNFRIKFYYAEEQVSL